MRDSMRWFEDDFDDDGTKPYLENGVYICRNCACTMNRKRSLCPRCLRRKNENKKGQEVGIGEDSGSDD